MKNKNKKQKTIIPIENPFTSASKKRKPKKGHKGYFGEKGTSKYHN